MQEDTSCQTLANNVAIHLPSVVRT